MFSLDDATPAASPGADYIPRCRSAWRHLGQACTESWAFSGDSIVQDAERRRRKQIQSESKSSEIFEGELWGRNTGDRTHLRV